MDVRQGCRGRRGGRRDVGGQGLTPRSSLPTWSCLGRARGGGAPAATPSEPQEPSGGGQLPPGEGEGSLAPLKPKPAPALGMDV